MRSLALIVVATLAGIAGLHVYWAAGGRWGVAAAIPERHGAPLFRPGPWLTLAVAGALAAAAVVLSVRAGVLPSLLPSGIASAGSWIVAAVFLTRAVGDFRYVGLFRQVRDGTFAQRDALIFTPLSLALGVGAAVIAWGSG